MRQTATGTMAGEHEAAQSEPEHAGDGRAADRGERRGIQSIEVGGALLQALVHHGTPMMLRDLAREAGMPPAKAHPYLVSFGKLGLVEQDPTTGRYGLGPFSLHMGLAALHGLDPLKATLAEVPKLADDLQLNIAVAVWGNLGPTVVHIEECSTQIHINMRPGTVMTPLLLSATGRCFAAFLPRRVVGPILDDEIARFTAAPVSTLPVSRQSVDELLDEVREHRLARAIGNPIPGINAFSVPVFNHSGAIALALTAMGPTGTFDVEWRGATASRLRECADSIARRLGVADNGARN